MQPVRLTFQKGHKWPDEDIALSSRLLGLRKIFEICRQAILVVENEMLLDKAAPQISFAGSTSPAAQASPFLFAALCSVATQTWGV